MTQCCQPNHSFHCATRVRILISNALINLPCSQLRMYYAPTTFMFISAAWFCRMDMVLTLSRLSTWTQHGLWSYIFMWCPTLWAVVWLQQRTQRSRIQHFVCMPCCYHAFRNFVIRHAGRFSFAAFLTGCGNLLRASTLALSEYR